jgi:integrase/recombinase XerD
MALIYTHVVTHYNEYRVKLIFDLSQKEVENKVKLIPGLRWSDTMHRWHMPYEDGFQKTVKNYIPDAELIDYYDYKIEQWNKLSSLAKSFYQAKLNVDFEQDIIELILFNIYNKRLIATLYTLGARWRPETKHWYFNGVLEKAPALAELLNRYIILPVFVRMKSLGREEFLESERKKQEKAASEEFSGLIKKMNEGMRYENFSTRTIQSYTGAIRYFLSHFKSRDLSTISNDELRQFILQQIDGRFKSRSYQNQLVNSIKHFYKYNFERVFETDEMPRPKPSHALPKVLSKEDVKKLLLSTSNLKHRTILCLIYSAGLRISEAIAMKVKDIDSERMIIKVCQAKGRKDRIVALSYNILEMLRKYYKEYKPKEYLFEGAEGVVYSTRSIQSIFRAALAKSHIGKPATVHTLRHSFATHLHESGIDLRYIQELLGHTSPKTTQIYTHISTRSIEKISSPFDDFRL